MTTSTLPRRLVRYGAVCIAFFFIVLTGCLGQQIIESDSNAGVAPSSTNIEKDYPGKNTGSLFFWELRREATTLYLFGTIHLGSPDLYPLDNIVISAFEQSQLLVEEIDFSTINIQEAQNYTLAESSLPGSKTLADYLSKDERSELEHILEQYEIPYNSVAGVKPWVVDSTINTFRLVNSDLQPEYGLDLYFTVEAQKAQKSIYGLETAVEQLAALNSMSLGAQTYLLKKTIASFDSFDEELEMLLNAWIGGDVEGLATLISPPQDDGPAVEEYKEILLIRRNIDWLEHILSISTMYDTIFVAVGTGHLIGEESLIDLLIQEGFSARRY